jgi:hypothetical protein
MTDRYEPKAKVLCSSCGWIEENKTEFLNIEEDMQGRDVITFRCPGCEQIHKSLSYNLVAVSEVIKEFPK